MELKMNFNSFIKIKDFFKLLDVSAEVDEYKELEEMIEGKLNIKGKYLKRDNVTTDYFSEYIPFTIILSNTEYIVEDILCVDIEYVTVESRGFDVTFDILVKYNNIEEALRENIDDNVEKKEVNFIDFVDFEEIKKNETNRIDELLNTKLNGKEDNHPTDEIILQNLNDRVSNIKICYYENERDLNKICQNNNIGLNDILNNNKKFINSKYKRVMMSDNE